MENESAITNLSEWICEVAADVCPALFAAHGVSISRTDTDISGPVDALYCGVIGFIGESIRGTCLLAISESPLKRSSPVDGSLRDWAGELTNQLVGRIKVRLLARQVKVDISTPVVLRGEHLAPLPRQSLRPVVLRADPGVILLWVEMDVREGFVLPDEVENPELAPEGEFVLF